MRGLKMSKTLSEQNSKCEYFVVSKEPFAQFDETN
jgi:hypothetical protein